MNTFICLAALALSADAPAPLHCPEPAVTKGEVKCGPVLVHTFDLSNRGSGILTITRLESSCGCLRRSISRDVLRPGESARLVLEVNTLTQPSGPNRWQVAVHYTVETAGSPLQVGELSLQVTGTLVQELIVSPPQLAFSTAGAATQTLSVTDRRANPLTILKATATSPKVVAEVGARKPLPDGGCRQEVTISVSADIPGGRTDDTLVLTTTDQAYPELRVPVRIEKRVAGDLSVTPEAVTVRFGSDAADVATLVSVRRPDGKAVGILSAACDHPAVTVKASAGAGAIAAVRVTVPGALAVHPGSGTVKLKLDDGRDVTIPVRWDSAKKE
jgi:hypothetical protein